MTKRLFIRGGQIGLAALIAFFPAALLAESGARLVISDWSMDTASDGAVRIGLEIRNHSRYPAARPELVLTQTATVGSSVADIVLARTWVDIVLPSAGAPTQFALSVSAESMTTATTAATNAQTVAYQLTIRWDDRGVRASRAFRSTSLAARPAPVESALTGRPFNEYSDIEIANYSFSRDQNALFIRGTIRNGLNETVDSIQTTLSFQRYNKTDPKAAPVEFARHSFFISGRLAPGQTREFITETSAIAGFDDIVETLCVRRLPDEALPSVDFAGIESVEAAFIKFETSPDSSRTVQFAIRNGRTERIGGIVFVLTFHDQSREPLIERIIIDKPFERGEVDFFSRTLSYSGGYDSFDWRAEIVSGPVERSAETDNSDIR